MTWRIDIPYRSREESLVDVASHTRTLADEDRAPTRQLVIQAMLDGVATSAGELVDHLAGLQPDERRDLLDRARTAAGLETTREIDAQRNYDAIQAEGRRRATLSVPACAAAGCNQLPTTPEGALREVRVVKWWCPQHVDMAAPGDMDPRPLRVRIAPSGAIVESDPVEEARAAAADESRRAQAQAEAQTRAAEADEIRARERAERDRLRRETPIGA